MRQCLNHDHPPCMTPSQLEQWIAEHDERMVKLDIRITNLMVHAHMGYADAKKLALEQEKKGLL